MSPSGQDEERQASSRKRRSVEQIGKKMSERQVEDKGERARETGVRVRKGTQGEVSKETRCSPGTIVQGNHSSSVTHPYLSPGRSPHACRVEKSEAGVLSEP